MRVGKNPENDAGLNGYGLHRVIIPVYIPQLAGYFEHSLEVLEDTVEHGVVRTIKLAVPIFIGVVLAAVGAFVLGNRLRDRAEARDIERAMRRARSSRRGRRAA